MNCTEAQRLIDKGIQPGSRSTQSAELGFHLAQCAQCREYRQQQSHMPELPVRSLHSGPASRLASSHTADKASNTPAPTSKTASPRPSPAPVPITASKSKPVHRAQRPSSSARVTRWLWMVSLALLISIPVGGLLWVAGVALRVNQDLNAMIVAPPSETPSVGAGHTMGNDLSPVVMQEQAQLYAQNNSGPYASPTPWPTLQPPQPSSTLPPRPPDPPPAGEAVTLLLLGIDQRPGERTIPRTDTVMLLRIDPVQRRIAMLSLPRDLWVEIPGYGYNRVNSAYVWGEMYQHPGGGLALAHTTVSQLTGIAIDYVFLIDFQAFIALIDNLGGIMVNVEEELYDNQFPTMDFGYTEAHFLPGLQAMNGTTTLTYCRIRHPDSDFLRLERQQAVLVSIGNRIRERGDLQNIVTADQFTESLRGYVVTDMPSNRILGLAWALRDLQPDQVERYTLDANDITFGVGTDLYAQRVSPAALEQVVRQFIQ